MISNISVNNIGQWMYKFYSTMYIVLHIFNIQYNIKNTKYPIIEL